MKKLSKILAVLLTACVLLGLVAVFASADADDYREHSDEMSNFSTRATVSANALSAWTTEKDGKPTTNSEFMSAATVAVGSAESPINQYLRFYAADANGASSLLYVVQPEDAQYKIKDYKYAVVQYLFGAEGGKYVDGAYIKPTVAFTTASNFGAIKIVKDAGAETYHAEGDTQKSVTQSGKTAPLTTVDGDWNVVTMVIKPRHNNSNAVGTNANFAVYYYVNGVYLGDRTAGSPVELGHVTGLEVGRYASSADQSGHNITLDGYNARYYLNGLDIKNNSYTTPDFYGVDDFIPKYTTADVTQCKDILYSAYSTTKDFPKTLDANGNIHEQTGAKVYIGDMGYMDAAGAFLALKDGETAKVYGDVNITGVLAKSFTVEVYNNAKVNFGGDVTSTSNILPGEERDGITRYVVSPKRAVDCVEIKNNVDSALSFNGEDYKDLYRTWTDYDTGVQHHGTVGSKTTVNGNDYWRMFATTKLTNTGGVNGYCVFPIDGTTAPSDAYTSEDILNYKYTATEYLFMAEGLNYPDGMSIEIRYDYKQSSVKTKNFGRVYIIEKDGAWYASADGTTPGVPLSTVEGAWNTVTQVSAITNANKATRKATVETQIFVNGTYLSSMTVENEVVGSMTAICFNGHKNSEATPGDNICVDGMSIRNFGSITEDYVSDSFYGIDDYFADCKNEVEGATPISCYDLAYNVNTTFLPATSGEQDYKATINGVYNFLYPQGAIFHAVNNDVITTDSDIVINILPEGIEELFFDGAGAVTLSASVRANYAYYNGVLKKNIKYFVNWLLSEGAEPFKTEELTYTIESPVFPNAAELSGVVTDILGNYNNSVAWLYRVGDGEYKSLSDFEICRYGDVVTLIPCISTVHWYHADGTLKVTELWFVGSEIEKQENDLYGGSYQNNGWYELIYGWDSTDFIAKPGTVEYRQVMAPVSAVDIRFNFTLDGGLAPTYYIKAPFDNIKIKQILASTDFENGAVYDYSNSYEKVKIGEQSYYMYNLGGVSLADYDAVYSFQVVYEIEVEGMVYTLESNIAKTSIAYEDEEVTAYAKAILLGGAADAVCSEETEFIAGIIELIKCTYALENDGTIDALIDAYVDAHKALNEGCTCFGGVVGNIPREHDSKVSYADITKIGAELSYAITENGATLSVKVPKTVGERHAISVSAALVGIGVDKITNRNEQNEKINVKFRYAGEDEEFFIYTANSAAIKAYNAANVQMLTVSCDGKTVATGTFSLSEYVYKMNEALDFFEWSNVDADNDGNVDGFVENEQTIGTPAERKEFDALLAFLNFSKESEKYISSK